MKRASETAERSPFLFGVDLEDVRHMIEGGERYESRVARNVEVFLELLGRHGARATFFTVGDVARRYPQVVRDVIAAGHEIACHSANHAPLERLGPRGFRDDLLRARDDLASAGASDVRGYRAPMMSLVAETTWAYDVLSELGFTYSSSVVPASTAKYGWPGHPRAPVRTESGVWEIPVSVIGGRRGTAFLSGVYFRLLPFFVIRAGFRRLLRDGHTPVAYFHPYDVDTEQERFMHPEIGGSRFLNHLMYVGRARVVERLGELFTLTNVITARKFVEEVLTVRESAEEHEERQA